MIVRRALARLLLAVGLWFLLIAACFLYSYIRPSSLAYVGLAFLDLWYFYIPFLLVVVSVVWFFVQRPHA